MHNIKPTGMGHLGAATQASMRNLIDVLVHQAGLELSPVFDLSVSSLSGMNQHVFVFQGQVTG